ncbi:MAG: class II aldolase/adducin family protein [Candidatus Omnitrophica bacterium]|nr:class II aldolase/adducin family protein [Candidatus Omnitrophota bacterium]MCM8824921.1 class II aldolase/adducin family protein [Candidatus Omnitrophota bacterium]
MEKKNDLKKRVYEANLKLFSCGLVAGTQGNVSGLDKERKIIYIKPSGVPYEKMKISDIVGIDFEGNVVDGKLRPSVDWIHHVFLYRNIFEIGGVVHTHSIYATAFAACGISVPCFTTGQADVFGGEIPVTEYADNKSDNIGKMILKHIKPGCPAVIAGKHGLFAFDSTPEKAVFAAHMAEYFAKINLLAIILGNSTGKKLKSLPESEIKKWYERYHGKGYGQK